MRKLMLYMALLLPLLSGCMNNAKEKEKTKWVVTLEKDDKRPYGAYLAYESLKYFFPAAQISPLSAGFKYYDLGGKMMYNNGKGRKLLVLSGFSFRLTEAEWSELKQFVSNGNEVFIICNLLDERIEKELDIETRLGSGEVFINYTTSTHPSSIKALSMAGARGKKYGYRGRSIKGYFNLAPVHKTGDAVADNTGAVAPGTDSATSMEKEIKRSADDGTTHDAIDTDDSTYADADSDSYGDDNGTYKYSWSAPDTLGYVNDSVPNLIRFSTGEGHLTLHAAPLAFSNLFLLQKGNEQYLSALWHTLPADINHIYWSDYYERNTEASNSEILWRHPATRLAMMLAIFALIVYILFEGKRKQRIIPVIAPLKNDSVSFVETVGRLYYNKGNHANLADKMILQFLEWVRTYYLLNTNLINEAFVQQLIIKSGQPEATVRGLTDMIHEVRLKNALIDDPYLYQLYNTIQQFYKNHRI